VEWGTLYGFSRYSSVMLTNSFSDLGSSTFLVRHLQTIYYKMAELCLLQRATVLSYSDEVTHVSNLLDDQKRKESEIVKKISELYKHYILFVNKIYFREVTAQEQGIEMYNMMQGIMRLPSDVKDLDGEIGELNQFASIILEQKQTSQTTKLTKLATLFVIPTLLASLLGMNVLPNFVDIPEYLIFSGKLVLPFWISIGLITGCTAVGYWLINKLWLNKKNKSE
ncbi:MAG: hypothetical protein K8H86_09960, partial [Ignavibacteriaceae bacterium]|nr:hypothetical protein [Ignavibacteriaceae bacterium]